MNKLVVLCLYLFFFQTKCSVLVGIPFTNIYHNYHFLLFWENFVSKLGKSSTDVWTQQHVLSVVSPEVREKGNSSPPSHPHHTQIIVLSMYTETKFNFPHSNYLCIVVSCCKNECLITFIIASHVSGDGQTQLDSFC